jgi:hypothetical protein
MLRNAILITLCLIGQVSFAQSLYQVKFEDKNHVSYKGLMVYYNESKAYMRISYTNNNQVNVVNVDYISVAGKLADGTNYFFMQGSNPKFMTDNPDKQKYNPDYFIWTYKTDADRGLPFTTDDSTFNKDNLIKVEEFSQLKPETVTEAYLRVFYGRYEPELYGMEKMCGIRGVEDNIVRTDDNPDNDKYKTDKDKDVTDNTTDKKKDNTTDRTDKNDNKNYTDRKDTKKDDTKKDDTNTPDKRDPNSYGNTKKTNDRNDRVNNDDKKTNNDDKKNTTTTKKNSNITLHFVIVANTLDGTIGKSCVNDKDRLNYEFSSIADALQIGYKQYEVSGYDFNKENVTALLDKVNPSSNDIVFFIYRGHGFRWSNQTETWPRMDLRTSFYTPITDEVSMNLNTVYNTIVAKGARLNIVLGDCCNSVVGMSRATTNNFLNPQGDNRPDISKLKKLFISARGNIISAAAKPGEEAWVNELGGFYTTSFMQALKEQISFLYYQEPDWQKIINYTVELARDKTSRDHCTNCTLQDGILFTQIKYSY